MSFEPVSPPVRQAVVPPEEASAIVRTAAQRLLEDLDQGERATGGWADETLGRLLVDQALSDCLNRLATTGLWGEANRRPSAELWAIAGPTLEEGYLQQRARSKPLGYAGDHVILARMWERKACEAPLGRLFDGYFLDQAAPAAVRARIEQAAAALAGRLVRRQNDSFRVVSIGAGPAIDIQLALRALSSDLRRSTRITLLDLDPQALEDAGRRLAGLVGEQMVECRRENLYRLASNRGLLDDLAGADLLLCPGLFDYVRDEVACGMLRAFWECLAPGGTMLVGNFAPHNPTRAYMEWIGNWYLVYRSAGDLDRLGGQAGLPDGSFSVRSDRTGVDLFLTAQRS